MGRRIGTTVSERISQEMGGIGRHDHCRDSAVDLHDGGMWRVKTRARSEEVTGYAIVSGYRLLYTLAEVRRGQYLTVHEPTGCRRERRGGGRNAR